MDEAIENQNKQTVLLSIFILFFIQLFGLWIESFYRISLLSLSSGSELLALGFVLAPLILLIVPKSLENAVLILSWLVFLSARVMCLYFEVMPTLMITSFGVAASFIIFVYFLSAQYRFSAEQFVMALVGAFMTSVLLRTWGSSVDLSTDGAGVVITLILVAMVIGMLFATKPKLNSINVRDTASIPTAIMVTVGIFANLTILYFIFFNPAVLSAWSEVSYGAVLVLTLVAWTCAVYGESVIQGHLSTSLLVLWNSVFVGVLVGGILLHTPDFPQTADSSAYVVVAPGLAKVLHIYLLCVLSPVILFNLKRLAGFPLLLTPRGMALPVVLGGIGMIFLTLCHIYTNVWGYVGDIGDVLRGKFYLPFLLAGLVMTVTIPFTKSTSEELSQGLGLPKWFPVLMTILILVGGVVQGSGRTNTEHTGNRLTILTYNMRLGSEIDGKKSYREQLDLIRQINPDLIGLQESDTARPAGWHVDVARYYADELGYYMYVGPTTIGGTFGTAVLSRYPFENAHTVYSFSTKDEVGTAVIEVKVSGRTVAFFNSHPAGKRGGGAKQAHVEAVIEASKAYEHVIAVGDYNFRQGETWHDQMDAEFVDSWLAINPSKIGDRHPSIGLPADGDTAPLDMTRRIDHIFVSDSFTIEESYYVPVPESMTDHPAHWAVVSWE